MSYKTIFSKNKTIILFVLISIVIISLQNIKWIEENSDKNIINLPVENCDVQKQRCHIISDEFNIEISLENNIYYLKNFNISVWSENNKSSNIESIFIDFKMEKMNMGVNRFMLTKLNSEYKQRWQGKALLPVCVTGRADWFSDFEVETKTNRYVFRFPINVKRISN